MKVTNYKSFYNNDCCPMEKHNAGRPEAAGGKGEEKRKRGLFIKLHSDGAFQEINFLKCDT